MRPPRAPRAASERGRKPPAMPAAAAGPTAEGGTERRAGPAGERQRPARPPRRRERATSLHAAAAAGAPAAAATVTAGGDAAPRGTPNFPPPPPAARVGSGGKAAMESGGGATAGAGHAGGARAGMSGGGFGGTTDSVSGAGGASAAAAGAAGFGASGAAGSSCSSSPCDIQQQLRKLRPRMHRALRDSISSDASCAALVAGACAEFRTRDLSLDAAGAWIPVRDVVAAVLAISESGALTDDLKSGRDILGVRLCLELLLRLGCCIHWRLAAQYASDQAIKRGVIRLLDLVGLNVVDPALHWRQRYLFLYAARSILQYRKIPAAASHRFARLEFQLNPFSRDLYMHEATRATAAFWGTLRRRLNEKLALLRAGAEAVAAGGAGSARRFSRNAYDDNAHLAYIDGAASAGDAGTSGSGASGAATSGAESLFFATMASRARLYEIVAVLLRRLFGVWPCLFGSGAAGLASLDSDVDVVVLQARRNVANLAAMARKWYACTGGAAANSWLASRSSEDVAAIFAARLIVATGLFERFGWHIECVESARVPILKVLAAVDADGRPCRVPPAAAPPPPAPAAGTASATPRPRPPTPALSGSPRVASGSLPRLAPTPLVTVGRDAASWDFRVPRPGDGALTPVLQLSSEEVRAIDAKARAAVFADVCGLVGGLVGEEAERTPPREEAAGAPAGGAVFVVPFDISFNNEIVLYNTRLMRTYAEISPLFTHLAVLLKHWARRRGVSDAFSGTLSGYQWSLMLLHFCQHYLDPERRAPILPNVQTVVPLPPLVLEECCPKECGLNVAFYHPFRGPNRLLDLEKLAQPATLKQEPAAQQAEDPAKLVAETAADSSQSPAAAAAQLPPVAAEPALPNAADSRDVFAVPTSTPLSSGPVIIAASATAALVVAPPVEAAATLVAEVAPLRAKTPAAAEAAPAETAASESPLARKELPLMVAAQPPAAAELPPPAAPAAAAPASPTEPPPAVPPPCASPRSASASPVARARSVLANKPLLREICCGGWPEEILTHRPFEYAICMLLNPPQMVPPGGRDTLLKMRDASAPALRPGEAEALVALPPRAARRFDPPFVLRGPHTLEHAFVNFFVYFGAGFPLTTHVVSPNRAPLAPQRKADFFALEARGWPYAPALTGGEPGDAAGGGGAAGAPRAATRSAAAGADGSAGAAGSAGSSGVAVRRTAAGQVGAPAVSPASANVPAPPSPALRPAFVPPVAALYPPGTGPFPEAFLAESGGPGGARRSVDFSPSPRLLGTPHGRSASLSRPTAATVERSTVADKVVDLKMTVAARAMLSRSPPPAAAATAGDADDDRSDAGSGGNDEGSDDGDVAMVAPGGVAADDGSSSEEEDAVDGGGPGLRDFLRRQFLCIQDPLELARTIGPIHRDTFTKIVTEFVRSTELFLAAAELSARKPVPAAAGNGAAVSASSGDADTSNGAGEVKAGTSGASDSACGAGGANRRKSASVTGSPAGVGAGRAVCPVAGLVHGDCCAAAVEFSAALFADAETTASEKRPRFSARELGLRAFQQNDREREAEMRALQSRLDRYTHVLQQAAEAEPPPLPAPRALAEAGAAAGAAVGSVAGASAARTTGAPRLVPGGDATPLIGRSFFALPTLRPGLFGVAPAPAAGGAVGHISEEQRTFTIAALLASFAKRQATCAVGAIGAGKPSVVSRTPPQPPTVTGLADAGETPAVATPAAAAASPAAPSPTASSPPALLA